MNFVDITYKSAKAVTPSDAAFINCRGLFIGVGGVIVVVGEDDAAPVTLTVVAGSTINLSVKQVLATGTTAAGIVALT
jgi:hypothetical protein